MHEPSTGPQDPRVDHHRVDPVQPAQCNGVEHERRPFRQAVPELSRERPAPQLCRSRHAGNQHRLRTLKASGQPEHSCQRRGPGQRRSVHRALDGALGQRRWTRPDLQRRTAVTGGSRAGLPAGPTPPRGLRLLQQTEPIRRFRQQARPALRKRVRHRTAHPEHQIGGRLTESRFQRSPNPGRRFPGRHQCRHRRRDRGQWQQFGSHRDRGTGQVRPQHRHLGEYLDRIVRVAGADRGETRRVQARLRFRIRHGVDQLGDLDPVRIVPDDHPPQGGVDLDPGDTRDLLHPPDDLRRGVLGSRLVHAAHVDVRTPLRLPSPPTAVQVRDAPRGGRDRRHDLCGQGTQGAQHRTASVVRRWAGQFPWPERTGHVLPTTGHADLRNTRTPPRLSACAGRRVLHRSSHDSPPRRTSTLVNHERKTCERQANFESTPHPAHQATPGTPPSAGTRIDRCLTQTSYRASTSRWLHHGNSA